MKKVFEKIIEQNRQKFIDTCGEDFELIDAKVYIPIYHSILSNWGLGVYAHLKSDSGNNHWAAHMDTEFKNLSFERLVYSSQNK